MQSYTPESFDFIVVGAGASGCTLATRIAESSKKPKVLLVEAGGKNDTQGWRVDAERWLHRFNPTLAWGAGYETVPQKDLNGQKILYDRGKGLGGSTAVNFSTWNIGPKDDHDHIATLVGDDEWKWDIGARQRYNRIEDYYGDGPEVSAEYKKFLNPKPKDHGHGGLVKIGYPRIWEKSVKQMMDTCFEAGILANPDLCSGNPIGVSAAPSSAYRGIRATAADQLQSAPDNLHILTDSQIARVRFTGKRAEGIETLDGRRFEATKEVVLSAGSLNTPAILMHSGIGPADQLRRFGIPIVLENPYVGQHLRDHCHIIPTFRLEEWSRERLDFYRSKELQAAARAQWETDQSGPLSEIGCIPILGFLKSDAILQSHEFQDLPDDVKQHLSLPTVPSYEFILGSNLREFFVDPANSPALVGVLIILANTQSRGQCTLQSSDPSVPLLFDPKLLSHPYDRRVALEATKEVFNLLNGPAFGKVNKGVFLGPTGDSDEEILAFWGKEASSTWHMSGTVKMGKQSGVDGACVSNDFKVFGVEGLRVADMSVLPIMVNNHTQTTAYLVGLMAGDRLAKEYHLDD